MARLPNAQAAILDIRKLSGYSLNSEHPRGKNKARVFRRVLAIGHDDAVWLRQAILDAVVDADAFEDDITAFGTHWRADIRLTRHDRQAVVRTLWMIRTGDSVPRFISCWVP
jgi:hypothetical protein